jgi:hypothetical protein
MAEAFPRLSAILTKFDTIIDWKSINESLDTLTGILGKIGEGIGEGLVTFFEGLSSAVSGVLNVTLYLAGGAINWVLEKLDGVNGDALEKVGKAIGVVLGAFTTYMITAKIYNGVKNLAAHLPSLLTAIVTHPAATIALCGVALAGALHGLWEELNKSWVSDDVEAIAGSITALEEALSNETISEEGNYRYISGILGMYMTLNDKLLNGDDLTAHEAELLESYKTTLMSYSDEIIPLIDGITGAYTGTREELQKVIDLEHDRAKKGIYDKYLAEYEAALTTAQVTKEIKRAELARQIYDAMGYGENPNDYQKAYVDQFIDQVAANGGKYDMTSDNFGRILGQSGAGLGSGSAIWTEYIANMGALDVTIRNAEEAMRIIQPVVDELNRKIDEGSKTTQKATKDTEKASQTVKTETERINTAVGKTSKKTAQAIDESGKAVEKGIERPWKKAYSTIKKEGAKASEAAEEVMDDIEEEITNSGPDLQRAGTGAAGAGLGAVRAVLDASVTPLTSKYKFIAVSMIEGFNKTFGIHGNTSTVGEEQGKKITGGIGVGTDSGTPALVTKFMQLPGKLKAGLGDVFNFFRPSGSSAISGIQTGSDEKKPSLVNFFAGIPGALVASLGNMKQTFKPSGVTAITGLQAGAEAQRPSAVNAIVGIKNALVGAFAGLNSQMWGTGHDAITSLRNGWTSVSIPTPHFNVSTYHSKELNMKVPNVAVGWYASGGLATSPSLVGVGEAGNEAILPLRNPGVMSEIAGAIVAGMIDSGAMANAITKGMVAAGQNNDRPVIVNATLRTENNEVLARAVAKGQQQINYRHSPVGR